MSTAQVEGRLEIIEGDITTLAVDAIVNAANESLMGGAGVDGAIHRAAGPKLLDECLTIGGCPTGEARITKGYDLPARFVIHTVGPIWRSRWFDAGPSSDVASPIGERPEDELLARCYRNSLALAEQHGIKSIAFPSISTGAYSFPVERACRIALAEIRSFLRRNSSVVKVLIVCFEQRVYDSYMEAVLESKASGVGSDI